MTLGALLSRALAETEPGDATEQRVLDAALAVGAEATVDDIARRAGVGRMTVFRRFGSKEALLERLAVRELRRFLERLDRELEAVTDPAERVERAFVACLQVGREHPFLHRADPQHALALLHAGEPPAIEIGRQFVAERLRADGIADADAIAGALVRLATSYVLLPGPDAPRDDAEAAAFARVVLTPLVA